MEITDLLTAGTVALNMRAVSKKQALEALAERAAAVTGLSERAIFDVLLDRERLGSTGVGRGVAIPHGKLAGLDRIYGLLATFEHPIPFDAIDDEPVDVMFLLLAPETAGAEHLKALSRVSRLLRDRGFCDRLRAAESEEAVMALLPRPTSHAA